MAGDTARPDRYGHAYRCPKGTDMLFFLEYDAMPLGSACTCGADARRAGATGGDLPPL